MERDFNYDACFLVSHFDIGAGDFADGDNAKLIRKEKGVAKSYIIKLDSLIRDGNISMNRAVMPGDTIIIPESSF